MHNPIAITPRQFDGQAVPTVNARELWQYVESRQDFSDWIKNRIAKYEFIENVDYLLHKFMEQLPSGAKHVTDYHLTLDMAKELAMVENNPKGREVRRYFIDCERQAKAAHGKHRRPRPHTRPRGRPHCGRQSHVQRLVAQRPSRQGAVTHRLAPSRRGGPA